MAFDRLAERIGEETRKIGIPAWGVVVYKEHRELFRHVSGHRDYEGREPLTDDTVFWLYSLTKVATCAAAMQLVERGALSLQDEVSRWLPAFANMRVRDGSAVRPARAPLRVIDLITMRGGLDYSAEGLEGRTAGPEATNEAIIDAIAKRPLQFDPGERYLYSLCHDVLAGVIAKAGGMPYAEWLRTQLFEPLGMGETRFVGHSSQRAPFCAQYMYENGAVRRHTMENHLVFSPEYTSGGAGLTTTLRDYVRLLDALACGGVGESGARVLREESVYDMAKQRLTPEQLEAFGAWRPGYGYGLGVRTRLKDEHNPKGFVEFGWDGAAGAYGLCDLGNHLSVLYLQHVRNCGPAYDELHPLLRDLVYEAVGL